MYAMHCHRHQGSLLLQVITADAKICICTNIVQFSKVMYNLHLAACELYFVRSSVSVLASMLHTVQLQ